MKMTNEQFDGLVSLMRAIANSEARYPSEQPDADVTADRVRALFVDEEPEPAEEPREWRAQVRTAIGNTALFGVVDRHGTWWTDQYGKVWRGSQENAAKRARELNRVDART